MGTIAALIFVTVVYAFSFTVAGVLIITLVRARLKRLSTEVVKAEVVDETPIIRRQAENTGYTVSYGRGISSHNHYRYRNVIVGYTVTFSVEWQNGKKETIKCKKDSATYKRLMNKVTPPS